MKKIFSKLVMIRLLLAVGMVAAILLVSPHSDRQSYVYEQSQPWRYPLLTAEFDTPVFRDSISARRMRDSIDRDFAPVVERSSKIAEVNLERFGKASASLSPRQRTVLLSALRDVYSRGILEPRLYEQLRKNGQQKLRVSDNASNNQSLTIIDASGMLSPAKAFNYIDSLYVATVVPQKGETSVQLGTEAAGMLNQCLNANVTLDEEADAKFRSQAYLEVTGATGVIQKGQRIVDRGEIITPQIYTNLNTYLDMQAQLGTGANSPYWYTLGQVLYLVICISAFYIYLIYYRPRIYASARYMTFLVSYICFFSVFAILMFRFFSNGLSLVPFAAVPIVILVFFDSRTAIFGLLTTVFICTQFAAYPFQFIFMQICAGMAGTFSISQLSRRSQLLRTAFITFLVYCASYFTMHLLLNGTTVGLNWYMIGIYAINCVILSFGYVLIWIIERLFGFTSTVSLVELSDINSPILRKMAEVAPGTFQHSIQVSTLAAEAARAIGANTQLVRTGALYHDIGKTESPVFFTENQHGVNPHEGLDPETSAHKIISHVTDGLALASRLKLPAVIKDFIAQHHGKGITRYFYNTAVNNAPEGTVVSDAPFRYPGPNPQSRETAILMMADAVEAASRSLSEYSPENINRLVDNIVDGQLRDGLLKDSPISLRDIEKVKDTFKKRLATIYHTRIAYPELKKNQ